MSDSYSQYGEDKIVQEIFGDHVGSLLDIGAWDPIDKSNSRALIEKGWNAILIEPAPMAVRNLAKAYKDSKNVVVVQACVTLEDLALQQMSLTDDAVSTEVGSKTAQTWATAGGYYGSVLAATLTFKELLNQFGGFDFISIDTEGASVDLAKAFITTEMYPRVLIVEHDGRIVELMEVAQERGYVSRWANGTNVILEKR